MSDLSSLFNFIPADDPDYVDDMYELRSDSRVSIQVALYAGGYLVSFYDEDAGLVTDDGAFNSLSAAMERALVVAEEVNMEV